jgi:RHS repeat-associated protein
VEYVYLGGQLIASKSGAAYTFYVRDQLSVRQVLTDSTSGTTVTEQGHLPFGENWYPSGNTNKWTFTSYERDAVSGDDYAQARRYQYAYGRFSSPDPVAGNVANPQSWNRYGYTQNDPIDLSDPMGMMLCHCVQWNPGGGDSNLSFLTEGNISGADGSLDALNTAEGIASGTLSWLTIQTGWQTGSTQSTISWTDENGNVVPISSDQPHYSLYTDSTQTTYSWHLSSLLGSDGNTGILLASNGGPIAVPKPAQHHPKNCSAAVALGAGSVAFDVLGTIPGLGNMISAGAAGGRIATGIAYAGAAYGIGTGLGDESPVGAASAGAGLGLTFADAAMAGGTVIPVVGNVISGLTGLYDGYQLAKTIQQCW